MMVSAQNAGSPDAPIQRPAGTAPFCPPIPYVFQKGDVTLAWLALAIGFLFWEAHVLEAQLGAVVFIVAAIAVSLFYLRRRGARQNPQSLVCLAVILVGLVPLFLYDATPLTLSLIFFEFAACLVWVAYSCRTVSAPQLSGFILGDLVNQLFCVTLENFAGLFQCLRAGKNGRARGKSVLTAAIGIACSIPILALVLNLLISADSGFRELMERADFTDVWRRLGYVCIGVPVAAYIFGAVHGNASRRKVSGVTRDGAARALAAAHRLPVAAVYAPMAVFCGVYAIFFAAMGSYLFSAFSGDLPASFTYAEYARRGFFELCGVAAVNLAILVFVYSFAKRREGEYPQALRVLSGILSSMTLLLVATAMSKMLLYIGAYGLTRQRLYTFWFMILLLGVFTALIAWHVRAFNAGRPIVAMCVGWFLVLYLANPDGRIARYNVEEYKNGTLRTVDVAMFAKLSDAAAPWLRDLAVNAPDTATREKAEIMLLAWGDELARPLYDLAVNAPDAATRERAKSMLLDRRNNLAARQKETRDSHWFGYNLQSSRAAALLAERAPK